jgi:hypothetical protein
LSKRYKFLLQGGLYYAPGGLNNLWPSVPLGWLFNVYIKRRYLAWWSKYNYITTTAFTSAIAICAIVIFFALQYNGVEVDWIGNSKPFGDNCDNNACPLLVLPEDAHFGPGVGEFS